MSKWDILHMGEAKTKAWRSKLPGGEVKKVGNNAGCWKESNMMQNLWNCGKTMNFNFFYACYDENEQGRAAILALVSLPLKKKW